MCWMSCCSTHVVRNHDRCNLQKKAFNCLRFQRVRDLYSGAQAWRWEGQESSEISKPAPTDSPPPARPPSLTFPNSSTNRTLYSNLSLCGPSLFKLPHACLCTCVQVPWGQKMLDSVEMKLLAVLWAIIWVLWTKLKSFGRASSALNC